MLGRKIKMARKIKCKKERSLLKRKIKGLERENTVHPRMKQIMIVTEIHHQRNIYIANNVDNDSSSESSKEEMSLDEHTSSWFSIKSSGKKNKWKFSKQLKQWAKSKVLKHVSNQEVKESILENNPVPSNFLS